MDFICKSSHATAVAGVFATPWVDTPPFERTDETNTNDFRPGYLLDALSWNGYGFDIPCGYGPVRQLLGWLTASDKDIVHTSRYAPQTVRPYSLGKDKLRYDSLLSRIATFVTGGDPSVRQPRSNSWYHETDTVHVTAKGKFLYGERGQRVYPTVGTITQLGYPVPAIIRNGVDNPDTAYCYPYIRAETSGDGLTFSFVGVPEHLQVGFDSTKRVIFDTTKSLKRVKSGYCTAVSGYAVNHLQWHHIDADIVVGDLSATVVLRYLFENFAYSNHLTYKTHQVPKSNSEYVVTCVIHVSLQDPGVLTLGVAGDHRIAMIPGISMSTTYELRSYDVNIDLPDNYGWPVGNGTVEPTFQTVKSHLYEKPGDVEATLAGFWDDVRVRYPGVSPIDRPAVRLRDWVGHIHKEMRGTAALSANDALGNYSSDSNFLESIPELPSIISYVGNILDFIRVFDRAAKGDVRAFARLVDALASAYLAYQYGVKPNISDSAEARRIAHGLANGLIGQFDGRVTNLYGSFTYDVPTDGLGMHGDVKLITRTKMVTVNDASGMLAMLLTLNQLGLLPTLARIWDLVPFSFVLDWILNLGDRFDYIDNSVLRLGLHVSYYVHTFEYVFSPRDTKSHYYSPDGNEDRPVWRVFIRERSLFHPIIKGGTSDFFPAGQITPKRLAIAGSLLWLLA